MISLDALTFMKNLQQFMKKILLLVRYRAMVFKFSFIFERKNIMKNSFIWSACLLIILMTSCTPGNLTKNQGEAFLEADFEYIAQIDFTATVNDLQTRILSNEQPKSFSEDALVYAFERNGVMHNVEILYYGESTFASVELSLDFKSNKDALDLAHNYLVLKFVDHCGQPMSSFTIDGETERIFEEFAPGQELTNQVVLRQDGNTLRVSFQRIQNEESELEDKVGEWVPRGSDGEMVWIPK